MKHPPGQIVNPIEDKTLADYIARKQPHPVVKLTFEEWFKEVGCAPLYKVSPAGGVDYETAMHNCWNSAQENM